MNTMQILKVVFSVAIAAVVNPVVTLGLKAEGAGYILAVSIGASAGIEELMARSVAQFQISWLILRRLVRQRQQPTRSAKDAKVSAVFYSPI